MRRKCPKCRLERCFAMGMNKDFIVSNEEKERRRKRLEENRNRVLQSSMTSNSTSSTSILQPSSTINPIPTKIDEIDQVISFLA